MNAKELRQAAELAFEWDGCIHTEDKPAFDAWKLLADHILATVREDDDKLIDDEWFNSVLQSLQAIGSFGYWYWDEKVPMAGGREGLLGLMTKNCVHEFAHIKTRGDFRTLCRLLGVTLKEDA